MTKPRREHSFHQVALVALGAASTTSCSDPPDCFRLEKDVWHEVTLERWLGSPDVAPSCGEGIDLSEGRTLRFLVEQDATYDADACPEPTLVRIEPLQMGSLTLGIGPWVPGGPASHNAPYELLATAYEVAGGGVNVTSWQIALAATRELGSSSDFDDNGPGAPQIHLVRKLNPMGCKDEWEVSIKLVDDNENTSP